MARVYVALDLETTGLDPERDMIIEIGVVRFRDQTVLDEWTTLVNPQRELPYRVQQLTGITPAQLATAPSLQLVIPRVRRMIQADPLVGHNVGFDARFLQRLNLLSNNPQVDTFELASIILPYASRYNLGKLVEMFDIKLPQAHRALDDARAARDLFLALRQRLAEMDPAFLAEVGRMSRQVNWSVKLVLQDIEAQRAQNAFSNTVGAQLRAKGFRRETLGLAVTNFDVPPAIRPLPQKHPVDADDLETLLLPGGAFAKKFPGFEMREPQIQMLHQVVESFNENEHAIIEAGTGTGKSVAYLIPAISFAVANQRRVIVSTATINLQDQLISKDLPDLQKVLPYDFRTASLKGQNNYLCRRRLETMRHRSDLSLDEVRLMTKILAWMPTTLTGDKSELTLTSQTEQGLWNEVAANNDHCPRDRCNAEYGDRCYFNLARRLAESAHVVVVNHSLLLSNINVEGRAIPEFDYLIIDEAHQLEDEATDQLGVRVDQESVLALIGRVSTPGAGESTGFLPDLRRALQASELPAGQVEKLL
ncbi:MAG: DEAD/DEAH box helicase, partial [Chloroflexi bacterium]|nr:DEAD/DEAH box helicase [Chloroflexota bacterium]